MKNENENERTWIERRIASWNIYHGDHSAIVEKELTVFRSNRRHNDGLYRVPKSTVQQQRKYSATTATSNAARTTSRVQVKHD